jgi:DNA-binding XRE family transcriptional regulator
MPTIKELRLSKLMSQRTLSKLAGITHATISRIETGKQKASDLTKARIAKALGCDIKDIA